MGQFKDGQAYAEVVQVGYGVWGGDQGWVVDEGGWIYQCVVNLGSWMDLGIQRQVGRVLLSLNCVVYVYMCMYVYRFVCVYVDVCICGGVYVVCVFVWGVCVCCVSVCDIVSQVEERQLESLVFLEICEFFKFFCLKDEVGGQVWRYFLVSIRYEDLQGIFIDLWIFVLKSYIVVKVVSLVEMERMV